MKLSEQSRSSIAEVVKKALRRYLSDKGQLFVTDIHLQPVQETGELVIYNDDDEELLHAPAAQRRRPCLSLQALGKSLSLVMSL